MVGGTAPYISLDIVELSLEYDEYTQSKLDYRANWTVA